MSTLVMWYEIAQRWGFDIRKKYKYGDNSKHDPAEFYSTALPDV